MLCIPLTFMHILFIHYFYSNVKRRVNCFGLPTNRAKMHSKAIVHVPYII